MARPRKKVTKQRVTLTISPSLLTMAQDHAYETGESLSGLVERLLIDEISRIPESAPVLKNVSVDSGHIVRASGRNAQAAGRDVINIKKARQ